MVAVDDWAIRRLVGVSVIGTRKNTATVFALGQLSKRDGLRRDCDCWSVDGVVVFGE